MVRYSIRCDYYGDSGRDHPHARFDSDKTFARNSDLPRRCCTGVRSNGDGSTPCRATVQCQHGRQCSRSRQHVSRRCFVGTISCRAPRIPGIIVELFAVRGLQRHKSACLHPRLGSDGSGDPHSRTGTGDHTYGVNTDRNGGTCAAKPTQAT